MNGPVRQLRVANIIEEGKLGGPQVRIANVACALKSRVETTVVLPLENSERFRAKLEECDIPYKIFNLSRITKEVRVALRYLFFSWYEVLQLVRYFRKENFDLIHVSGGSWQYKGVIAGKLAGRKVVWHLNDTSMPWFFRKIFFMLSGLVDAYIFASERSRKYYESMIRTSRPIFVIPAPVDTDYFLPGVRDEREIAAYDGWEGKFVVGTVANVNPIKGVDILIRVASKINLITKNVVFVVAGEIYQRQQDHYERLKHLCDELGVTNVEFIGAVNDIRSLLDHFDIYLCTSYAESSPISVWEAMSMGKAIVSSNVGDVPVYVRNGESGKIAEVGDVDVLADKVMALIQDESRRIRYGEKAREIAVNNLHISICAEKHAKAYHSICGELK